jgi:hypothetical protein
MPRKLRLRHAAPSLVLAMLVRLDVPPLMSRVSVQVAVGRHQSADRPGITVHLSKARKRLCFLLPRLHKGAQKASVKPAFPSAASLPSANVSPVRKSRAPPCSCLRKKATDDSVSLYRYPSRYFIRPGSRYSIRRKG